MFQARIKVVSVSHDGGTLSDSYKYAEIDGLERAVAVKVRAKVTAGGGGLASALFSLMDASDSSNAAINDGTSATYDGLLSTLQSTGTPAIEHTIAAGRGLIACNLGGLVSKLALRYKGNAATAAGDAAIFEVTIVEEQVR